METWLRTDEHQEAVSALEFAAEQASSVDSDVYRWKWVILGMHTAVQVYMVLALRGSDGLGPLKDEVAAKWLEAYRAGEEKLPEERLDTYKNLYKKVKTGLAYGAPPFDPVGSQGRSIKKLDELRDEFVHFTPKGWSLEVSGLPEICMDCIRLIRYLAFESGSTVWYREADEVRAEKIVEAAEDVFAQLAEQYAP